MKIAVCVKHVPCGTLRMRPDSSTLDRSGPGELNASDKNAIEEALRLKEGGDAEVVVVTMGPAAATESLRTGLGMGADRAVLVDDDAVAGSDLVATSRVLASVLERESPDLVLFGQQTTDGGGAVLWAAVAERLQWPFVSQATKLTLGDGMRRGASARPRWATTPSRRRCPAVVAVSDAINEPRYTSLKGMMAAKKKPLDTLTASDLGLSRRRGGRRRLADRRARHRGAARSRRTRSRSRTTAPPRRRSSTTSRSATWYEHPRLPRAPRGARCRPGRSACSTKAAALDADVAAVLVGDGDLDAARRRSRAARRGDRVHRGRRVRLAAARPPHRRARPSSCAVAASTPSCSRTRCSPPTSPPGSPPGSTPASTGTSSTSSCATASRSAGNRCCRTPCSPTSGGGRHADRAVPPRLVRGGAVGAGARARGRIADGRVRGAHRSRRGSIERTLARRRGPVARRRRRHRRRRHRPRLGRGLRARRGARRGARRRGRARPAPPCTRAGTRRRRRSARPARRSRPSSTSRSGSPVPCSTRSACRTRRRSSPSTRIRTRPIFEFSDLAVVGDVHTIVPELVELLRKHAG